LQISEEIARNCQKLPKYRFFLLFCLKTSIHHRESNKPMLHHFLKNIKNLPKKICDILEGQGHDMIVYFREISGIVGSGPLDYFIMII